jgi:hypothetical protein
MHTVQPNHQRNTEGEDRMKIIKDEPETLKRKRRVILELNHDEEFAVIQNNAYYRLGGQVDDVVQSHVIGDMSRVYWCSITQKWEEA